MKIINCMAIKLTDKNVFYVICLTFELVIFIKSPFKLIFNFEFPFFYI